MRNVSVLLESCLALPQAAQNYLRRDTAGLSVVMVVGWILGDFMKLVYFLIHSKMLRASFGLDFRQKARFWDGFMINLAKFHLNLF